MGRILTYSMLSYEHDEHTVVHIRTLNGTVYRLSFADPLKTTCLDQGYIYDDL